MESYQVLPCEDENGIHYKIYSSDLKTYYGNFYSVNEVNNKLKALKHNEKREVIV